jgi:hypothetical protein
MRSRRPSLIATALAIVVSSCGGSSSTTKRAATVSAPSTRATTSTSRALRVPSSADLNAALLRIDDVPTGYAIATDANDSSTDTGICNKEPVSKLVPSSAKVQRAFQKAAVGPFIAEELLAYSDTTIARSAVDTFRSQAQGCTSWQDKATDGTTTTYQLAALSFPRLGDDTFAFQLNSTGGVFPVTIDYVLIRHANIVMAVVTVETLAPGPDLEPLARTALDRTNPLVG